jgi:hypothetical protein
VSAETRVRDALRAHAALVVVDEDAAWRELSTRLEAAARPVRRDAQPVGRPRVRLAAVIAALLVVVLAVVGYALVSGDEGGEDRVAVGPSTSVPAPTGVPNTIFDTLAAGATVSTADWVDATRTLEATRSSVHGTITGRLPTRALDSSVAVSFTASPDGQVAISDSTTSTYVLADGTVVEVSSPAKTVRIRSDAAATVLTPDDPVARVVRPDLWLESSTAAMPQIVFDGRGTESGRETLNFTVSFASGTKWSIALDAATGVVVDLVVHDASAQPKVADQAFHVDDLDAAAKPLDNGAVPLPPGFAVQAVIGNRKVDGVVPPNATIGSVVAEVRARAAR